MGGKAKARERRFGSSALSLPLRSALTCPIMPECNDSRFEELLMRQFDLTS